MSDTVLLDRLQAVQLFIDMLDGKSEQRVIRITGLEKMGKSRLLREYQKLSKEKYKAECILIDLTNTFQDGSDILSFIQEELEIIDFKKFCKTQEEIALNPQVEMKNLSMLFSTMTMNLQNQPYTIDRHRTRLTNAFIDDLKSVQISTPLVFLFDAFDTSNALITSWLNEKLLRQLLKIPNIYVVFAGRHVPKISASLVNFSVSYTLASASIDDYRSYCEILGLDIPDETIQAFYEVSFENPGLFAEFTTKLLKKIKSQE